MRPDASENSQINPSTIVRAARAAGSQPYLPSGFQGRCKIATLHAGFGVIRGMSVKAAVKQVALNLFPDATLKFLSIRSRRQIERKVHELLYQSSRAAGAGRVQPH